MSGRVSPSFNLISIECFLWVQAILFRQLTMCNDQLQNYQASHLTLSVEQKFCVIQQLSAVQLPLFTSGPFPSSASPCPFVGCPCQGSFPSCPL